MRIHVCFVAGVEIFFEVLVTKKQIKLCLHDLKNILFQLYFIEKSKNGGETV